MCWFQTPHWAPVVMVRSHHRRGWGLCTTMIGNGLWQKSMYLAWFCLSDVNLGIWGWFQTPHWAPVVMVRSHHRRGWELCTTMIGNGLWQKSMYLAWFCLSDVNWSIWGLISNTTLGPSGHGKKPPSSKLGTLYNHYRQLFMSKIHVLRVVLFVQRQLNHCVLISNTTQGPSGSRTKPPSSRLRTLYSYYRQWFMTKIPMFRVVLLVWRQFKRCMSISNTPLGPNGRDLKPPSSRLGTLYSHYRQWFMKKNHTCIGKLCLSDFNSSVVCRFQTPHWSPVAMTRSHHRQGWGHLYSHCRQWFMTEINVLSLLSLSGI